MPLTKIDGCEVMYSANQFPPWVWVKSGGSFIGRLIFEPDGADAAPRINLRGTLGALATDTCTNVGPGTLRALIYPRSQAHEGTRTIMSR